MGWEPVAFSEIEKFPSKVLKHHYPNVPNLGDMTKYEEWNLESVELLVGGTPCQSFSVAGLRKGLDDPRGNLMLTYGAIAKRFKPKWLVWENVPGVLSSNGGRDFGTFLGMLAELGYGFAYRVLDAQFFGVAQRRRRVFVVGCLGDWRRAAAVLFERHSLSGNSAPSREKREDIANCLTKSPSIHSSFNPARGEGNAVLQQVTYEWHNQDSRIKEVEVAGTLNCNADGKEGHLVQPIPYDLKQVTSWANHQYNRKEDDPCHTLLKENAADTAIAFHVDAKPDQMNFSTETTATLTTSQHAGVAQSMAVRRLTPVECERLQGFPDNYTNIKENCPDGSRYKALGNSMAVPVMKWIGERIKKVNDL
jgi:DNA (cytosine-5)-methyltransferase 1